MNILGIFIVITITLWLTAVALYVPQDTTAAFARTKVGTFIDNVFTVIRNVINSALRL